LAQLEIPVVLRTLSGVAPEWLYLQQLSDDAEWRDLQLKAARQDLFEQRVWFWMSLLLAIASPALLVAGAVGPKGAAAVGGAAAVERLGTAIAAHGGGRRERAGASADGPERGHSGPAPEGAGTYRPTA
jgi:hypothetical protein